MLHLMNRMLPDSKAPTPVPSPTFNASAATTFSPSVQQDSQWGPSGIGTLVFGCVASVLGALTLWTMFWLRQRQPGHAVASDDEVDSRHSRADAAGSDDDVALEYLPQDGDAGPEATEGHREDA